MQRQMEIHTQFLSIAQNNPFLFSYEVMYNSIKYHQHDIVPTTTKRKRVITFSETQKLNLNVLKACGTQQEAKAPQLDKQWTQQQKQPTTVNFVEANNDLNHPPKVKKNLEKTFFRKKFKDLNELKSISQELQEYRAKEAEEIAKNREEIVQECRRTNLLFIDDIGYSEDLIEILKEEYEDSQLEEKLRYLNLIECEYFKLSKPVKNIKIQLDDEGRVLLLFTGNKNIKITLNSVIEIRFGVKTKVLENQKGLDKYPIPITIIYFSGIEDVEVNFRIMSKEKMVFFMNLLIRLIEINKENPIDPFYLAWNKQNKQFLSHKEIISLLQKEFGIKLSSKNIKSILIQANIKKLLGLDDYLELINKIIYRSEMDDVFDEYAHGGHFLTDNQFLSFLRKEQKLTLSIYDLSLFLYEFRDSTYLIDHARLSRTGFCKFLTSKQTNSVFNSFMSSVYHDMSHPLSDYFISSSHNTYLEGFSFFPPPFSIPSFFPLFILSSYIPPPSLFPLFILYLPFIPSLFSLSFPYSPLSSPSFLFPFPYSPFLFLSIPFPLISLPLFPSFLPLPFYSLSPIPPFLPFYSFSPYISSPIPFFPPPSFLFPFPYSPFPSLPFSLISLPLFPLSFLYSLFLPFPFLFFPLIFLPLLNSLFLLFLSLPSNSIFLLSYEKSSFFPFTRISFPVPLLSTILLNSINEAVVTSSSYSNNLKYFKWTKKWGNR